MGGGLADQWGAGPGFRTAPPMVPRGFVRRARVTSLLDRAVTGPVTLVSAGPGHGKTLALADWAGRTTLRVAWLSIDPSDDSLPGFWSALIASLQVCGAAESGSVLADLSPAASFGVGDTALVVDVLAHLPGPLVLVLDDFQHLRDRAVLRSIELLLDRLSPTVHAIFSARYDPPLRLRRLAISDRLAEIRADQLAFDTAEAGRLLVAAGLTLSPVTVSRLVDRTRGWAAGLRLAASSLDRAAPEEAVARLRGSDRPVADYLMQEVLDQLSDPDRRFLLRASLADPVTADLAQALTGVADGQARLESLEAGNGFIVGLAGGRTWFTWHPLFREMLAHRLTVEHPGVIGDLHRRAADWLVEHGENVAAIRHLTAAGDRATIGRILTERVAPDLVTAAAPALVEALAPVAAAADIDPTPTTLLASALCHFHRFDYEAMLRDTMAADAAVKDENSTSALGVDVLVASLRMGYARARAPGALTQAARHVLKVVDQVNRHQVPALERYRAIATTNLGTGLLWDGEFPSAEQALHNGETSCGRLGLGLSELSAQGHRAVLAALHGRLRQARKRAERARMTADQHGWVPEPQASAHLVALTIVARDSGRLEDAEHLITMGTRGTNPDLACRIGFAALAVEVALARGDLPLAGRRAAALADLSRRGPLPTLLADWARIVLAENHLARREVGAARASLHQVSDTGYAGARRAVTLARCLLVQDDPAAALQLSTATLPACAAYLTVAVHARVDAATAAQRLRRDGRAIELLTEAVDLAAEPGIIGPFLAAGESMGPLLDRHRTLVARHTDFTTAIRQALPHPESPAQAAADGPILTDRERAILPFLATHLKATEIAADLYLSVNTIKSHQQAIYRKLGVASRREAVDRSRELGLL
ncbi:MAG TPA: LuxR C-terminal-related transcriptional regulator [Nakamurella sp.]